MFAYYQLKLARVLKLHSNRLISLNSMTMSQTSLKWSSEVKKVISSTESCKSTPTLAW